MRFGTILLIVAFVAVLASKALANSPGVKCGAPALPGHVLITLTDGNNNSVPFDIEIDTDLIVTDEDKALFIRDFINNNSTVFSAAVTGAGSNEVEFFCGSPAVPVWNCTFISGTDEGMDHLKVTNQPTGGGILIVTLTGTPAQSGWVAAGITGTYIAQTSTSGKPTAAGILVVLRDLLIGHSISATINGNGELLIPHPQGTTYLAFGDTDSGLTIGVSHDE